MFECAARISARLSFTTFWRELISFFILASPVKIPPASGVLDQPCDFLRELTQQRVQLVVLFGPQNRQHERETSAAPPLFHANQPPRERPVISFNKPDPLPHREMGNIYNERDGPRRSQ